MDTIRPKRPWLIALLLLISGLAMTIGGVWLIALGGSSFYLLAGVALLLDAGLAWRRHSAALWIMALILLVTIISVVRIIN